MRQLLHFLNESTKALLLDVGLLALRLGGGGLMLLLHGEGKLRKVFGWIRGTEEGKNFVTGFPDPIGIGNTLSAISAAATESLAALFIMLGLLTRLSSVALGFTMVVAAFIVHGNELWTKGELALVYLVIFAVLALTGPGRFSLDAQVVKRFPR